MLRTVAAVVAAWVVTALAGCGPGALDPGTGHGGSSGAGGSAGGVIVENWPPLISDFEDPAVATVVRDGSPPMNGFWYAFNDGSPTCTQLPAPGAPYVGAPPPLLPPQTTGLLALRATWSGCSPGSAGIGADLNVPLANSGNSGNSGSFAGSRIPYDLSRYSGVTFLAMAMPGSAYNLRLEFPTAAGTAVADGGACEEPMLGATPGCGDDWGESFLLPANGTWVRVTVRFSDVNFGQAGWGAARGWNPADVLGLRIVGDEITDKTTDFWIDDMYLMLP